MPHLASKKPESWTTERVKCGTEINIRSLPNSRLHWARLHRVKILSVVERLEVNLLCSCLLQASTVGLIRDSITCMNTLPGTESRVMPRQLLHSDLESFTPHL